MLTGKDQCVPLTSVIRGTVPVLSGVSAPLFMKTCHSYLDDDLRSCHSCWVMLSCMEQSPMTVGQFPSKYVREPYDRRSCGDSTAVPLPR